MLADLPLDFPDAIETPIVEDVVTHDAERDTRLSLLEAAYGDPLKTAHDEALKTAHDDADDMPAIDPKPLLKSAQNHRRMTRAAATRILKEFSDLDRLELPVGEVRPFSAKSPTPKTTLFPTSNPSSSSASIIPFPTSKTTSAKSTPTRPSAKPIAPLALPSWQFANAIIMADAYNRALGKGAKAFTLNPGPKLLAYARSNPAQFKKLVAKRIRRELDRRGQTSSGFWFALEITRDGRVHVHGAIMPGNATQRALEGALAAAGGEWGSAYHRDKQVDVSPMPDPSGWVLYCLKDENRTKKHMGVKSVISASDFVRDQARAQHDTLRRRGRPAAIEVKLAA